jgi:hypothetical protein
VDKIGRRLAHEKMMEDGCCLVLILLDDLSPAFGLLM